MRSLLPQGETLAHKFVKRGAWLYFFTFLIAPTGYFIKVMVANDLSVEEVGLMYSILSLIGLLSVYGDLGIGESLQYYLPKYLVNGEKVKAKTLLVAAAALRLISGTLVGLGLFFASGWIGEKYFHTPDAGGIIALYSLYFFAIGFNELATQFAAAIQDTRWQKGIDFIRMLVVLLATSYLFFGDLGSISHYVIAWVLGVLCAWGLGAILMVSRYYLPHFSDVRFESSSIQWRSVMWYAGSIILANNIAGILHQADMQLLVFFTSTTEAGYYSTYQSLIGIPFLVLGPIVGMLLPVISELSGRGDNQKIALVRGYFRSVFALLAIVTSGWLFSVGPELASIFFGEKFAISGTIMQWSIPFIMWNFWIQIDFHILAGIGRAKDRTIALLVGLSINLILVTLAILVFPMFGLRPSEGAALGVAVSWIPLSFAASYLLRSYRSPLPLRRLIGVTMATVVIAAIIVLVKRTLYIDLSDRGELFIVLAVSFLFSIIPFSYLLRAELSGLLTEIRGFRASRISDR